MLSLGQAPHRDKERPMDVEATRLFLTNKDGGTFLLEQSHLRSPLSQRPVPAFFEFLSDDTLSLQAKVKATCEGSEQLLERFTILEST
jgi:hypothetical protein